MAEAGPATVRSGSDWDAFVSWDNLLHSWKAAAAGKRGGAAAARWEYRLGDQLLRLQQALQSGQWQPGRYLRFEVHEPKRRTISAAPFGDRVVHHALMRVTAARFERLFSPKSYANRLGMGTLGAIEAVSSYCRSHPWALRLDVKQHFPSIDHALLLAELRRRIADDRLMAVVEKIVASGATPLQNAADAVHLPGDDLLTADRLRGLPIGNLTSQWWSNVYMDTMDAFITRTLGCGAYARYVDDMVLFCDNKRTLNEWEHAVRDQALTRLRLRLHVRSAQAQQTAAGIPWLGMVIYPDHRKLKSRKVVAATRSLTRAWQAWQREEIEFADFDARVQGWIANAAQADSWRIRAHVLQRFDLRRQRSRECQLA